MNNIDQGRAYPVFTLKPEDIAALQQKNLLSRIISFLAVPAALLIPASTFFLFDSGSKSILLALIFTGFCCCALMCTGFYMQRTVRRDLEEGRKYVICGRITEKIKEPRERVEVRRDRKRDAGFTYSLLLDDGYRLFVSESQFIHFCEGERIRASKTVQSRSLLNISKE